MPALNRNIAAIGGIGGLSGLIGLGNLINPDEAEAIYAGPKAKGWKNAIGKFSAVHDRKQRFEIDDSRAALGYKPRRGEFEILNLGDILKHDELYRNYPELRDMAFYLEPDMKNLAEYYPGDRRLPEFIKLSTKKKQGKDEALDNLLHEVQHAVQKREGFAPGTSMDVAGSHGYITAPGEIEGRDVSKRRWLSKEGRLHKQPYEGDYLTNLSGKLSEQGVSMDDFLDLFKPSKKKIDIDDVMQKKGVSWEDIIDQSRKQALSEPVNLNLKPIAGLMGWRGVKAAGQGREPGPAGGGKDGAAAGLQPYEGGDWPTETQRTLDHQQRIRDLYSPERARELQMRDIAEREALQDTWNPLESVGTGIIGGMKGVIGNMIIDPALEALGL